MTEATYEFGQDFQDKILAMSLVDETFLQASAGLVKPEYFETDASRWLAQFASDHYNTYRQRPSKAVLLNEIRKKRGDGSIDDALMSGIKESLRYVYGSPDLSNRDYTLTQVEEFAQQQALTEALTKSVELLENGASPADIQAVMNKAVQVGITQSTNSIDLRNFEDRIKYRDDALVHSAILGAVPTGIPELDRELRGGGAGRKEMFLFMGGPKTGKSIAMMNCAVNAAGAGYNVLFMSCENSTEVTGDRMDTYISGVKSAELQANKSRVRAALSKWSATAGNLKVHEFPTNTLRCSDIRRVLERYQSEGIIFDLLVVDYADIMAPERHYSDKRFALEEIYAGLRALAQQENLALITATQTNREGAKATQASKTDVAESIDKTRLADILISINATDDEKAKGEVRLFFAASRNTEDGFTLRYKSNFGLMRFAERLMDRY